MKKIILIIATIIILTSGVQNSFATKNIGSMSHVYQTMTYNEDLNIGSSFTAEGSITVYGNLNLGSMSDISGDLTVYGNFDAGSSIHIGGNLIVTGDINLGSSSTVNGYIKGEKIDLGVMMDLTKIYANKNLSIGSSSSITKGVEVYGDLDAGTSMDFGGYSKVTGEVSIGSMSSIDGVFYTYKGLDAGTSIDFSNGKLKIVDDLNLGSSSDVEVRLYVYGDKEYGIMVDENLSNYNGLFGMLDPLLIYTFSESKIREIKNKTDSYLSQANTIKNKISSLESAIFKDYDQIKLEKAKLNRVYVSLFGYLEPLIESEEFDKKIFNNIKSRYLGNFTNSGNQNDNNIAYSPSIPYQLKIRLNKALNKIPLSKKNDIYINVINKIDTITTRLKAEKQNSSIISKINLLLGIQEYIQGKLNNLDSTDILNEIGL